MVFLALIVKAECVSVVCTYVDPLDSLRDPELIVAPELSARFLGNE